MFDAEVGKDLAYQDAFSKLWQLYGFNAKEALFQAVQGAEQNKLS